MSGEEFNLKQNGKTGFQPPSDATESQLMTPSQLQLPTLSALVQDVPNIDQYRPKEIVRREGAQTNHSGSSPSSSSSPGAAGSQTGPLDLLLSRQNDWDIPKALVDTSTELRLYDLKPRYQTDSVWTLSAKVASDHRPVGLHVGKMALNDSSRPVLLAHLQKLQSQSNPNLVKQVTTGTLIGGYPYVLEEHIEGPTFRECHAGIHLPGTKLHWKTGHALQLMTAIRDLAYVVDELHQAGIFTAEISIDAVKLSRSEGVVKLTHVGPLAPLQGPDASLTAERKRVADILGLGKILHAMLFCSSLNSSNKLENPPFANWTSNEFAAQFSSCFPVELGEVIVKSRHAVRSQQFSSAREFGLAVDAVLKKARVI